MIEVLCLFLALLGLTAYAVFGGADFGAGFWDLTAGSAHGGARMRGVIERSMTVVWEANHVWLIFVLVVLWTCFPTFFGSMMSSLYIPMAIAMGGIILRGTAFVLRGQATTLNEARGLGAVFALSSVILPFAFGTVIGAIASGRVEYGNAQTSDIWSVWLNPFSIYVGILAVATSAYLAAVFLIGDSHRMGADDMVQAFRKRALISGSVAGLLAIGGLPMANADAPTLYDGLTSGMGLVCVVASTLFGVATMILVAQRTHTQLPRVTAAGAVGAITAGWAFAQSPYLLPGVLTYQEAAGDSTTLTWLVICVAIGLLFLVPSLFWLYKLTLKGDLQPTYRDADEGLK
ncbi:MAG: cytochrome d ubiquinol oxidase subunit II [Thermoleophilaceae bacterium]|nr:cytochrome d ubiquinol oxidase subunit II [Thermoleophilaceae bacterium]